MATDSKATSGLMSFLLVVVVTTVIGTLTYSALKANGLIGAEPEPSAVVLETQGIDVKGVALMAATPPVDGRNARPRLQPENDATHIKFPVYFGTDRLPATPYDGIGVLAFLGIVAAWGTAFLGLLLVIIKRSRWCWWSGLCLLFISATLAAWGIVNPKPKKLNVFAGEVFGSGRSNLRCGLCTVSIPRDHEPEALEAPSILHFEFREDPAKHIILQRVDPMDDAEFKREFGAAAEIAAWPEALVFVHGYNVTFEDAARRTAQVAYDIKFGGLATFYSWPSNGQTFTYSWDEESVQLAVPHFVEFLELIAREGRLKRIHVIAHSMGNRCVLAGLNEKPKLGECRLDQCVFAAPDVDRELFQKQVSRLVNPELFEINGGRLTLYASNRDIALNASQKVHRFPRAGDARPGVLLAQGVESIDASLLETDYLGHSYFGDSPYLVEDLRQLIEKRLPAKVRKSMHQMPIGQRHYWEFRPVVDPE